MRLLIIAILATTLLSGCASTMRSGPPRPARISHIVLFKLYHPEDASELIGDCDRLLARMPVVGSYAAGRPLDTGRGDRVDGNYDVALYVGFATEADYATYVEHPDHKAIIKKWTERLQWLRVHDFLDDTQ